MRRFVLWIDRTLRRRHAIVEFCDDPDCLFRIKRCRLERPLPVELEPLHAGAELLELHVWNEHVPRGPDASLSWAAHGRRLLVTSLAKLARHLERSPELEPIEGVFGITTFMSPHDAAMGGRVLARLGFSYRAYRSPRGGFVDFWENVHVWLLHRAFGERSKRLPLSGLRRVILWMPRARLVRRYATRPPRPRRPAGAD